jgi:hypothetical protein
MGGPVRGAARDVTVDEDVLRALIEPCSSRIDLWTRFIEATSASDVAEIGVYRGDFAAEVLRACPGISTYYMIDPWRRLDDWNKPANKPDRVFDRYMQEALDKTREHEHKRVVLRGRTTEVVEQVPDGSLDFAYVDGDHTLRGIAIDLIRLYPKVRDGGWIGGDDFRRSIWQHGREYEPTLVFPFAVHFAEAMGTRIVGLPFQQFLIEKDGAGHEFVDLTGSYGDRTLKHQFDQRGG